MLHVPSRGSLLRTAEVSAGATECQPLLYVRECSGGLYFPEALGVRFASWPARGPWRPQAKGPSSRHRSPTRTWLRSWASMAWQGGGFASAPASFSKLLISVLLRGRLRSPGPSTQFRCHATPAGEPVRNRSQVALTWAGRTCSAMKHAGHWRTPTLAFDHLDLMVPVCHGELVHMDSRVVDVGSSTIVVQVVGRKKDLLSRLWVPTHTAYVTFVSVGSDGKKQEVPELLCETDEERREKEYVRNGRRVVEHYKQEQARIAADGADASVTCPAYPEMLKMPQTEIHLRKNFLPRNLNGLVRPRATPSPAPAPGAERARAGAGHGLRRRSSRVDGRRGHHVRLQLPAQPPHSHNQHRLGEAARTRTRTRSRTRARAGPAWAVQEVE